MSSFDPTSHEFDLALIGAGPASVFFAKHMLERYPALRLVIFEQKLRLGDSQTWAFQVSDLVPGTAWLKAWADHHWEAYKVIFPWGERTLNSPYCAMSGERFDRLSRELLGARIKFGQFVQIKDSHTLKLSSGLELRAKLIIEAQGFSPGPPYLNGWQSFYGLKVALKQDHGLTLPLLMDTQVGQNEAYRFIYVLPMGPRQLLIEDTYYNQGPIDPLKAHQDILAYAAKQAWTPLEILHTEHAALPIPLYGAKSPLKKQRINPCLGLQAGIFHATTGYSLAMAAKAAYTISQRLPLHFDPKMTQRVIESYALEVWRQQSFLRRLNNMLFFAGRPESRLKIFARFYQLSPALIGRFYAGNLRFSDCLRLVSGRPPVPLWAGIRAFFKSYVRNTPTEGENLERSRYSHSYR